MKAGPRAASRENVRSAVAASSPSTDTDADGVGWGRRSPGNRDGRYRGWLPGAQLLTFGEVLAGTVASALVCLVVAISLALAQVYWAQLPESVANNHALVSRLCGLAGGLCLTVRLRDSRLARRAHLRGER